MVGRGSGCLTGDFDGQGAIEKEEDSGWESQDIKPGIRMVRGVDGQGTMRKAQESPGVYRF